MNDLIIMFTGLKCIDILKYFDAGYLRFSENISTYLIECAFGIIFIGYFHCQIGKQIYKKIILAQDTDGNKSERQCLLRILKQAASEP